MKLGLSADETAALLGDPLQRVRGRGFETWTYDGGGEVLLYAKGSVIGWTAPAVGTLRPSSHDVWIARPGTSYGAVLRSITPPPAPAAPVSAPRLPPSGVRPSRDASDKRYPAG